MHKIEKELRTKTKLKPGEDEERSEFLIRVARATSAMNDEEWEGLSLQAQDWSNDTTKSVKDKKGPLEFGETLEDDGKKAAKAKDGKKDAKGKGDEDEKPAKAAKGERKSPKEGLTAMMFIRHYLVSNPAATVDEIMKAIEKEGYKVPTKVTVGTVRSDFRSITRIYKERGFFKNNVNVGDF